MGGPSKRSMWRRVLCRRAVVLASIVALIAPVAILAFEPPAGATEGDINTVAGAASSVYNGDGISAASATLFLPSGVAVDAQDNVVIADAFNHRVRVVAKSVSNPGYPLAGCVGPCTWTVGDIYTVTGTGTANYNGDGIAATAADVNNPIDVKIDPAGDLVIGDKGNNRVRVVALSASNPGYSLAGCAGPCTWTVGDIFTVAGTGGVGYTGDGILATSAPFSMHGIAVDSGNNILIADDFDWIIRVVAVSASNPGYPLAGCAGSCTWNVGDIFTVTGAASISGGYSGDGGAATAAQEHGLGVVVDSLNNVLVADTNNGRVRVVAVSGSNPGYPLAGSGCGGPCTWSSGNIYTVAGDGSFGYLGDGGMATSAQLAGPQGVAVDAQGNVVVTDSSNNRVRVIAVGSNPGYLLSRERCAGACTWTAGDIYTVAGSAGSALGDGGPATSAILTTPNTTTLDAQGNLVIADTVDDRVRVVNVSALGVPDTVAPVSASITAGYDAVWEVAIRNASSVPLTSVSVTLHATANGSSPLTFDESLMPGCAAGAGNSEVCAVSDVSGGTTRLFKVYVPTTGMTTSTTIAGDFDVSATGLSGPVDASGALGTVTIVSCGTACVKVVAAPSVPVASSPDPPTPTRPTKQLLVLPTDNPNAPAVAVTLNSVSPASAPVADRRMCPTTGSAPRCTGQISVVAGNFSAYANRIHPIQVKIVARWPNSPPAGGILMQDDTAGSPPIQLPKCLVNATTHRYNTPCARPETATGSVAAHTRTTTNTILFVSGDPHFARRLISTPNAPTGVLATAGKKLAKVQWKVPTVTNGTITGYSITAYLGTVPKKTVSFTSTAVKETVTGLLTGKYYTFKVSARNSHGSGFLSIASKAAKVT